MDGAFARYAPYYDLLNRDKPYSAEVDYVLARLRQGRGEVSTLLDLGAGTGVHGRLMAARGLHVRGVEQSAEMVAAATGASIPGEGSFECEQGDIRAARLHRSFDAVTALFHVVSYMTSDEDFAAVFNTARAHTAPDGLFLFDVWHAPAVLAQRPSVRERNAEDGRRRVIRKADPELRQANRVVVVNFEFDCQDLETGERLQFTEQHRMRYFSGEEVAAAATLAGFEVVDADEMLTGRPPSEETWAVTYLLRAL